MIKLLLLIALPAAAHMGEDASLHHVAPLVPVLIVFAVVLWRSVKA